LAYNHFRGRYNKFKPKEQKHYARVNFYIKAPTVRVVQEDGSQLGVHPIDVARKYAQDAGLDLVEIVPNANPPVCKLTNYDKYCYEQKQKEKEAKKIQKEKTVEIKQIRLRPCTQANDIEIKSNSVIRFLDDGKKVVVTLEYKKRELAHREEGYKIINALLDKVKEHTVVEMSPKMNGNKLVCVLSPKAKEA